MKSKEIEGRLKIREVAERINAHLKAFEADPKVTAARGRRGSAYYMAGAGAAGAYVSVCYISYQGHSNLKREEAERYLAWLDAGNEGRHHQMPAAPVPAVAASARYIYGVHVGFGGKAEVERAMVLAESLRQVRTTGSGLAFHCRTIHAPGDVVFTREEAVARWRENVRSQVAAAEGNLADLRALLLVDPVDAES